jgi:hypothetical protein
MFGRHKKDPGPMIEATAIVTDVQDTGQTADQNQRIRLTLNVQPARGKPWEVTKKISVSRLSIPQVGDPIRVAYFENARDSLAVKRRGDRTYVGDH